MFVNNSAILSCDRYDQTEESGIQAFNSGISIAESHA